MSFGKQPTNKRNKYWLGARFRKKVRFAEDENIDEMVDVYVPKRGPSFIADRLPTSVESEQAGPSSNISREPPKNSSSTTLVIPSPLEIPDNPSPPHVTAVQPQKNQESFDCWEAYEQPEPEHFSDDNNEGHEEHEERLPVAVEHEDQSGDADSVDLDSEAFNYRIATYDPYLSDDEWENAIRLEAEATAALLLPNQQKDSALKLAEQVAKVCGNFQTKLLRLLTEHQTINKQFK